MVSLQRSRTMRAVKNSNNKSTELKLIEYFKRNKITGWRRNYSLPGKPDFVFPKLKMVVFADGCFWHGHNCRRLIPRSNQEYWVNKITRNKQRDKHINKELKAKGWKVVRIWECKIPGLKNFSILNRSRAK